jgi:small-conductance mechanosensitive channel
MEPADSAKGGREFIYQYLLKIATILFAFGYLFLWTNKGNDRRPDFVIFLIITALLLAALCVGRLKKRSASEWRSGPASTIILVVELMASLYLLIALVAYGLHRGP